MELHSSTLAWKIPWMEEPGRLQSMGSLRVGHDWATSLFTFCFHALEKAMATHSSVLAWKIPGTGKPGGLPSMGSHKVGHDWNDLVAAAYWCKISYCIDKLYITFYWPGSQTSILKLKIMDNFKNFYLLEYNCFTMLS